MKTFALYLVQMIACSGIFYAYYHFFLRNNKFHQYNRYYLLAAAFISLIIPFLKIPVYLSSDSNGAIGKALIDYNTYLLPEVVVLSSAENRSPGWEGLLAIIYLSVALFLLYKIALAIMKLVKLRLINRSERQHKILFVQTDEAGAPFSFFNWIFWNHRLSMLSDEGQKILKHEVYHVQQKHSFDILFLEITSAILWINPFYHFIKKELRAIHEFLADDAASGAHERLEYAEILVLQAIGTCKQNLVNPFFNNQLKRRITMLTSNKNTSWQYLRKILVLPLLAVITVLFVVSCKNEDSKSEEKIAETNTVKPEDSIPATTDSALTLTDKAVTNPTPANPEEATKNKEVLKYPEVYTKVEIDAMYTGGYEAWRNFLEKNLRPQTPLEHNAPAGTYTTIIQFIVDREGNVSDVKPLTKQGYGMEDEAVRVIKASGKWKPAIMHGQEVKAYRKQPITFKVVEG